MRRLLRMRSRPSPTGGIGCLAGGVIGAAGEWREEKSYESDLADAFQRHVGTPVRETTIKALSSEDLTQLPSALK